jgi:hypothetical protein
MLHAHRHYNHKKRGVIFWLQNSMLCRKKGTRFDVAVSQYLSASFTQACQITYFTTLAARLLIWPQAVQLLLSLLESVFVRVLSNNSVLCFTSFGLIQFAKLSWTLWLMLKIKRVCYFYCTLFLETDIISDIQEILLCTQTEVSLLSSAIARHLLPSCTAQDEPRPCINFFTFKWV